MAKLVGWFSVLVSWTRLKIKDRLQSRLWYRRSLIMYPKDDVIGLHVHREGYRVSIGHHALSHYQLDWIASG
jgi:hypothetical protein